MKHWKCVGKWRGMPLFRQDARGLWVARLAWSPRRVRATARGAR
jgi:hypothetical protein